MKVGVMPNRRPQIVAPNLKLSATAQISNLLSALQLRTVGSVLFFACFTTGLQYCTEQAPPTIDNARSPQALKNEM